MQSRPTNHIEEFLISNSRIILLPLIPGRVCNITNIFGVPPNIIVINIIVHVKTIIHGDIVMVTNSAKSTSFTCFFLRCNLLRILVVLKKKPVVVNYSVDDVHVIKEFIQERR